MEDATHRQVQALCPESSDCSDSTPVHKISYQPQYQRGRGSYSGYRGRGGAPQGQETLPGQLAPIKARLQAQYSPYVWILWESPTQLKGKSAEPQAWNAIHATNLDIFHTCVDKTWKMTRPDVKHIDTEEESQDWPLEWVHNSFPISQMTKWKHQWNTSRLPPKSII